ncbi:MAG TPA: alpha/beta hydrolase [Candidatus Angelobacter sp.]|jgi:pimeloyl-ACP methyl ester carboxylesterase|nr:alpha/beta hydrolase [Candidatus Angelobacter sp.]
MELQKCSASSSNGATLQCCHTAVDKKKSSLLIALPFGVPVSVAHAPFEKFGSNYNVVTWESRYILNLEQDFSGQEKMTPNEHVEDMLSILKALDIKVCCLIGYCSGAGISLVAAKQYPDVFSELILVNGEYQLFKKGHKGTFYQRSIDAFLPLVAASRAKASSMFSTMAGISQAKTNGQPQTELDQQINLPFTREETLFRYAKNYMGYRDFDALSTAREVQLKTFVLTGQMDQHSNSENSDAVSDCIPGAKKFVDAKGDHYEFCRAGSLTLDVLSTHLAESKCW